MGELDGGEADRGGAPKVSVVVPAWNEEANLPGLLSDLRAAEREFAGELEIVVADGGSTDGTERVARAFGALHLQTPRGRGTQLRRAVLASRGDVLVCLHADVRLEPGALQEGLELCARGRAVRFRPSIQARGLAYRMIERSADWKGRLLGWAYGDGGLVVTRGDLEKAGGFEEVPLFEDLLLSRALRRTGVRLVRTQGRVLISARRWRERGICRTTRQNSLLTALFFLGVDPQRLARRYHGS